MAFNTGNPLGSTDPRDLYDNAENLDSLVNGEQPSYDDRLGRARKSWQALEDQVDQQQSEFNADQADREQRFNAFIASSGYVFAGDYAPGIEITEYNQVVRDTNGEFWRASGSTTLPYTTTGAGLPEGGAFVAVGDAVLRQELAANTGASLVGTPTGDNVETALSRRVIYVGSVGELKSRTPMLNQVAIINGPNAGVFLWDSTSSQGSDDKTIIQSDATASGRWLLSPGEAVRQNITYNIGPGGEFLTINKALDHLSRYQNAFISGGEGVSFKLNLLSGFVMQEQVIITNGINLGNIEIVSEDAVVNVDVSAPARAIPGTIIDVGGTVSNLGAALFGASYNCALPRISALFDASAATFMAGVYVAYNSEVTVSAGAGVLGASGIGAIHGSRVVAAGANFSNSKGVGVSSFRNSTVDFRDGIADNAADRGAYVGSSSNMEALQASFKNAGGHGIEVYGGARVHCRDVDVSGAAKRGLYCRDGSELSTRNATVHGTGEAGAFVTNGGKIYCEGSSFQDNVPGALAAEDGGVIVARDATINGSNFGYAITALRRSSIAASGSSIQNYSAGGVLCDRGSIVDVGQSSALSLTGGIALTARRGSTINADGAVITGASAGGVSAGEGSTVNVSGANISNGGGDALFAISASTISAENIVIDGCAHGIYAEGASTVDASRCSITGATLDGVVSTRGSNVNVGSATTITTTGAEAYGSKVERGGFISARGASFSAPSGSSNVTPNAITADGIIFA